MEPVTPHQLDPGKAIKIEAGETTLVNGLLVVFSPDGGATVASIDNSRNNIDTAPRKRPRLDSGASASKSSVADLKIKCRLYSVFHPIDSIACGEEMDDKTCQNLLKFYGFLAEMHLDLANQYQSRSGYKFLDRKIIAGNIGGAKDEDLQAAEIPRSMWASLREMSKWTDRTLIQRGHSGRLAHDYDLQTSFLKLLALNRPSAIPRWRKKVAEAFQCLYGWSQMAIELQIRVQAGEASNITKEEVE